MVEFIKKYYHLTIIISVFAWAGCASSGISPNNESERASIENAAPVNLEYDKTAKEEKNKDALLEQEKKGEKQLTLTDGSQYIEMKDAYGNKIEYRYFESAAPVKYISMETLDDGTTTMFIKPRNGAKKRVNPSLIDNPWKSNAREIASRAGIYSDFKLNSNQSVSSPVQSTAKSINLIIKNNPPRQQQELKPAEMPSNETNGSLKPE